MHNSLCCLSFSFITTPPPRPPFFVPRLLLCVEMQIPKIKAAWNAEPSRAGKLPRESFGPLSKEKKQKREQKNLCCISHRFLVYFSSEVNACCACILGLLLDNQMYPDAINALRMHLSDKSLAAPASNVLTASKPLLIEIPGLSVPPTRPSSPLASIIYPHHPLSCRDYLHASPSSATSDPRVPRVYLRFVLDVCLLPAPASGLHMYVTPSNSEVKKRSTVKLPAPKSSACRQLK